MRRRTWPLATLLALSLAVAGCGGTLGAGGTDRPEPESSRAAVRADEEIATPRDDTPPDSPMGETTATTAVQASTTTTTPTPDTTAAAQSTTTAPLPATAEDGATFDPSEFHVDTSAIDQLLAELDGLLAELDAGFAESE